MNGRTNELDTLIERQGWNDGTLLDLALEYISNQGDDPAWLNYLRQVADNENGSPLRKIALVVYYTDTQDPIMGIIDTINETDGVEFVQIGDESIVADATYDTERGTWVAPDEPRSSANRPLHQVVEVLGDGEGTEYTLRLPDGRTAVISEVGPEGGQTYSDLANIIDDNFSNSKKKSWRDSAVFRAARLLCKDGAEDEYLRACAEMVCDLSGTHMDDKEAVIAALIASIATSRTP